jgi:hypothetical protein
MNKIIALAALLAFTTPLLAQADTTTQLVQKINQSYHTSFPVNNQGNR